MAAWNKRREAFTSLDKAWKSFPRVDGELRILVFNNQGQPVVQYSRTSGATTVIDERECALGMEMARVVYSSIHSFSGADPDRVAFFFQNEVVTIEKSDPFILMVFWPANAARLTTSIEDYLNRLMLTLQEELT